MRRSAVAVAVLLAVVSCAGRSTEAFCDTFQSEERRLQAKYEDRLNTAAEMDPLSSLIVGVGTTVEAIGDIKVVYDRLEAKAPEEIQPDVATVRDALAAQLDALGDAGGNPLGSIFGGLITGLSVMGSEQRVNEFIVEECQS